MSTHETYVYAHGPRKWHWRCLDVRCPLNAGAGPYVRRMDADVVAGEHDAAMRHPGRCEHPYTRPATVDDQRPFCVSCLAIVGAA